MFKHSIPSPSLVEDIYVGLIKLANSFTQRSIVIVGIVGKVFEIRSSLEQKQFAEWRIAEELFSEPQGIGITLFILRHCHRIKCRMSRLAESSIHQQQVIVHVSVQRPGRLVTNTVPTEPLTAA